MGSDQREFKTNSKLFYHKLRAFPASDWLYDFYKLHSDWLNFRHFPRYQMTTKLVCRLVKRGYQALACKI